MHLLRYLRLVFKRILIHIIQFEYIKLGILDDNLQIKTDGTVPLGIVGT